MLRCYSVLRCRLGTSVLRVQGGGDIKPKQLFRFLIDEMGTETPTSSLIMGCENKQNNSDKTVSIEIVDSSAWHVALLSVAA